MLSLLDRAAQVALRMEDQDRRLDLRPVRRRRLLDERLDVLPECAAELPVEYPEEVARAEHRDEVVHRALGHRRLEAVRMADDPRGHVAAVRAAEHAELLGVDEVELLDRG